MTAEELLRKYARRVGLLEEDVAYLLSLHEQVRQEEREACARIAEEIKSSDSVQQAERPTAHYACERIVDQIRARERGGEPVAISIMGEICTVTVTAVRDPAITACYLMERPEIRLSEAIRPFLTVTGRGMPWAGNPPRDGAILALEEKLQATQKSMGVAEHRARTAELILADLYQDRVADSVARQEAVAETVRWLEKKGQWSLAQELAGARLGAPAGVGSLIALLHAATEIVRLFVGENAGIEAPSLDNIRRAEEFLEMLRGNP